MKTKMPRILSLLLALVMVVGLIPMNASAEINYGSGDNSFTCTFSTFEDLKSLVERANSRITWATYTGTEPLVIESNLTLYSGLVLECYNASELYIPAGVTLRTSGSVFFTNIVVDGTLSVTGTDEYLEADNFTVNGTVSAEAISAFDSLSGSGTITCSGTINANLLSLNAFDLNRIDLRNAEHANFKFSIASMEEFEALCAMASQDSRSFVMYGCTTLEPLSIAQSCTVPENLAVAFMWPSTIEQGCTLELNGYGVFAAPFTVKGTLINNSTSVVSELVGAGPIILFTSTGTYSGTGELAVYCETRDSLSSVITGIDMSQFQITERNDEDWVLGLFGQRWHLQYMGPDYEGPEIEPEDPNLPTLTGTYTTDLVMPAADLGVSAPDSVLRATLTFGEDGSASCNWEAVDLTAFRIFFHDMFVNAYYAMAYGAGITDLAEIERFCMESTGLSVSDYMDTLVTDQAMIESFTPASTRGTYSYNIDHTAIFTDLAIMEVPSDPSVENSFVLGGNTLYLNAASWDKPDYTFVCTAR